LRLALWLAPAVLFRALVPVGFMLEPVDGWPEIVLCAPDAPSTVHNQDSQDYAGHHRHPHADPTCPYAQSAGAAPWPSLAVLPAVPLAPLFVLPARLLQTHAHFGPTRQQSPRGPPRLA